MIAIKDTVVVLAGPYSRWVADRARAARGNGKFPSFEHGKILRELDNFDWMATHFTVRRISEGMATITGDGERRELPLYCLAVLKRYEEENKAA